MTNREKKIIRQLQERDPKWEPSKPGKRHVIHLWGVSALGGLDTSTKMSHSKEEEKKVAIFKARAKTYRQAVARGWRVVRVKVTHQIVEEK